MTVPCPHQAGERCRSPRHRAPPSGCEWLNVWTATVSAVAGLVQRLTAASGNVPATHARCDQQQGRVAAAPRVPPSTAPSSRAPSAVVRCGANAQALRASDLTEPGGVRAPSPGVEGAAGCCLRPGGAATRTVTGKPGGSRSERCPAGGCAPPRAGRSTPPPVKSNGCAGGGYACSREHRPCASWPRPAGDRGSDADAGSARRRATPAWRRAVRPAAHCRALPPPPGPGSAGRGRAGSRGVVRHRPPVAPRRLSRRTVTGPQHDPPQPGHPVAVRTAVPRSMRSGPGAESRPSGRASTAAPPRSPPRSRGPTPVAAAQGLEPPRWREGPRW